MRFIIEDKHKNGAIHFLHDRCDDSARRFLVLNVWHIFDVWRGHRLLNKKYVMESSSCTQKRKQAKKGVFGV